MGLTVVWWQPDSGPREVILSPEPCGGSTQGEGEPTSPPPVQVVWYDIYASDPAMATAAPLRVGDETVGSGEEGLRRLAERLRGLPKGTVVEVVPELAMATTAEALACGTRPKWLGMPEGLRRALERVAAERDLVVMYLYPMTAWPPDDAQCPRSPEIGNMFLSRGAVDLTPSRKPVPTGPKLSEAIGRDKIKQLRLHMTMGEAEAILGPGFWGSGYAWGTCLYSAREGGVYVLQWHPGDEPSGVPPGLAEVWYCPDPETWESIMSVHPDKMRAAKKGQAPTCCRSPQE